MDPSPQTRWAFCRNTGNGFSRHQINTALVLFQRQRGLGGEVFVWEILKAHKLHRGSPSTYSVTLSQWRRFVPKRWEVGDDSRWGRRAHIQSLHICGCRVQQFWSESFYWNTGQELRTGGERNEGSAFHFWVYHGSFPGGESFNVLSVCAGTSTVIDMWRCGRTLPSATNQGPFTGIHSKALNRLYLQH